jgi:hypothetical protein
VVWFKPSEASDSDASAKRAPEKKAKGKAAIHQQGQRGKAAAHEK